jgi:hypothetical protein
MSDTDRPPSVIAGLMKLDDLGPDIGKGRRAVARYVNRGLPIIKIGRTPYVDPIEGATARK